MVIALELWQGSSMNIVPLSALIAGDEKGSGNQLQIIRLFRNRLVSKGADDSSLA
jgi:hypothetical protein